MDFILARIAAAISTVTGRIARAAHFVGHLNDEASDYCAELADGWDGMVRADFQHFPTSDRPFGMPPDVEQPRRK